MLHRKPLLPKMRTAAIPRKQTRFGEGYRNPFRLGSLFRDNDLDGERAKVSTPRPVRSSFVGGGPELLRCRALNLEVIEFTDGLILAVVKAPRHPLSGKYIYMGRFNQLKRDPLE